ncbi:MAG TPA: DNA-binding protein [Anaerolineaceae bacterium]|nr:DNA-binding protein [Anaerolineaceae bacterium]
MADDASEIMTIEEVARFLKIPQSSIYRLAQQGKIPCSKIGRHWRFRRVTIEKWFDETSALYQTNKLSPKPNAD